MQIVEKTIISYKCEICGHEYPDKSEAISCKSRAVTQDNGVKVGDTVMCIRGQGSGKTAVVEEVYVIDKYWGHCDYVRYWHTIAIVVKFDIGARHLTFDDYRRI